jgi:3',5'-cyclic AMP phosphodiesterase CpdA
MAKLAHLSDLHLIEENYTSRRRAHRFRLEYLSIARPIDAAKRRRGAARALEQAWRSGADHLVITGDLTEDGVDAQFEVLGAVLAESPWPASRVTLVPGNHDAYHDGEAFQRALAGPLQAYRDTSTEGTVTALPGALLVAVSTSFHQSFTRSAGAVEQRGLDAIDGAATEAHRGGLALVVAQHHPPRGYMLPPIQFIDGLRGHAELRTLLLRHDHTHVLHGHTHVAADKPVRSGASARIFSAEAVVDSASPLRLYKVEHGHLRPDVEAEPFLFPAMMPAF